MYTCQYHYPMPLETFYASFPKNKIELYDGKIYIGNSLEVSRMVLYHILRGYGPDYVLPMIDNELLQEAMIEAFGRGKDWEKPTFAKVYPSTPVHRVASELMMNIFSLHRWGVFGRDLVVKIGEDAFTPDIYVYGPEKAHWQKHYYFDGAPDLAIEIVHPNCRDFDWNIRLPRYQQAKMPEIWMMDFEKASITVFRLNEGEYEKIEWASDPLHSTSLPGLKLWPNRLWEVKANPMKNYHGLVTDESTEAVSPMPKRLTKEQEETPGWGSIPFQPDIGLKPVPITFQQFISWTPEAKFEWWDDRPQIGGSDMGQYQLTGLLMMTLGLTETLQLVGPDFVSL